MVRSTGDRIADREGRRGDETGVTEYWGAVGCSQMRIRKMWWIGGGLGALGLGCALSLIPVLAAANVEFQISRAEMALQRGDFAAVEPICAMLLAGHVDSLNPDQLATVRRVAARAAFAQGSVARGLEHLRPLLTEGDEETVSLVVQQARRFSRVEGKTSQAESLLKAVLRFDQHNSRARRELLAIWKAEGQWYLINRACYELLRQGESARWMLTFVVKPSLSELHGEAEQIVRTKARGKPLVQFGMLREDPPHDTAAYISALRKVIAAAPDSIEPQVVLGEVLASSADEATFGEWREQLPQRAWKHPGAWRAAAIWLSTNGQPKAAIRCCWESLRRQHDQASMYELLTDLLDAERDARAEPYRVRESQLEDLTKAIETLRQEPKHLSTLRRAMTICRDLGRYWEAWGWAREMALLDPTDVTTEELQRQLEGHLADDLPPVVESFDPVLRFRLDSYPLPTWRIKPRTTSGIATAATARP